MHRPTCLLVASVVMILLGSGSPKEFDDATQRDIIEGGWIQVAVDLKGREFNGLSQNRTIFCNGTYAVDVDHGTTLRGNYYLDTSRTPYHLDLIPSRGRYVGQTIRCICQIHGEKLVVAFRPGDDMQRPRGFSDDDLIVETYKRIK